MKNLNVANERASERARFEKMESVKHKHFFTSTIITAIIMIITTTTNITMIHLFGGMAYSPHERSQINRQTNEKRRRKNKKEAIHECV